MADEDAPVVMKILALGVGLFVAVMILTVIVSVFIHMG